MFFKRSLLASVVLWLSASARVLVVHDNASAPEDFSKFWRTVEERHDVIFRNVRDTGNLLYAHDVKSFDNIIFFASAIKTLPDDLSPQRLLTFLSDGGNILIASSSGISELWRDFAREFDIDFDNRGTAVVDYFGVYGDLSSGTIGLPAASVPDNPITTAAMRLGGPILYRGVGHRLGRNPLLVNVLSATPTAISRELGSEAAEMDEYISGSDIGLVTAIQTRENARVIFAGSIDMFSDAFVDMEITADGRITKSGNQAFVGDLVKWVFQETGVLRIVDSFHMVAGGAKNPKQYRVRDTIEYELRIQALRDGVWGPFPATDMQLEFSMLDPHLRHTLSSTEHMADSTLFRTSFEAPDRHGVFTFKVDYRRPGWTFLKATQQVAVTPPRHDEYPRFIGGAAPYYTGATSVVFGFATFVFAWLLHNPSNSH